MRKPIAVCVCGASAMLLAAGLAFGQVTTIPNALASIVTNLSSAQVLGWMNGSGVVDTALQRDAAATLSVEQGSNAQEFRVYGGSGVYLRLVGGSSTTIRTNSGNLNLGANDSNYLQLSTAGNLVWFNDNSNDIGSNNSSRPRNIYVGTTVYVQGQKATSGQRYACIDTAGQIVSSATACSGT